MKVLLGYFEPFNGPVNASKEVAVSLRRRPIQDIRDCTADLAFEEFPCRSALIRDAFLRALDLHQPDVCLFTGEAGGRSALTVEALAKNVRNFRIPDLDGFQVRHVPIHPDAPAAYFSNLTDDNSCLAESVRTHTGVPTEVSYDAGEYLCNELLFEGLHFRATQAPELRVGFVHVPVTHDRYPAGSTNMPWMSLRSAKRGLAAVIRKIAGQ